MAIGLAIIGAFFFPRQPTTDISPLSLHDALPISSNAVGIIGAGRLGQAMARTALRAGRSVNIANSRGPGTKRGPRHGDRKSTRLNSSHDQTPHAVLCLKKKKNERLDRPQRSSSAS